MAQSPGAVMDVPVIETIVVQPTPFCNINCSYCYLPQRAAKSVMAQETIATLFTKVFASGWVAPYSTIIWHAGEPLVLPVSYYEEAFSAIEALRPKTLALRHSFQTNGMLITPQWCDFFKKWNVGVGVSIDGPQDLHDAHRVTRSGQGTYQQTIAGIRLLQREAVPYHVISVLSSDTLDRPDDMVAFYVDEGIENVCFNVEESEGDHVSGLFALGNLQARFHQFLARFWALSRQSNKIRFIREIDDMLPRIFRPEEATMGNAQVRPFGMLNVDCHGNVSSFSPEFLGHKHDLYNDFIIGNITHDSLADMRGSPAMQAMTRDIAAGVEKCRQACAYFSICGGGAPVNKLTENGTFDSDRTAFCSLIQMAPTDIILDALEHLENTAQDAEAFLSSHSGLSSQPGAKGESQPMHAFGILEPLADNPRFEL
jgi:uncharacterized protein